MAVDDPPGWYWKDAAEAGPGNEYRKTRGIERRYVRQLVSIARHVGGILDSFGDPLADPAIVSRIRVVMQNYSATLRPWAEHFAGKIVKEVDKQDETAWLRRSRQLSRGLREELRGADTGAVMRARLAEQVDLITSLPTVAAQRVHDLTLEGITQGTRAEEIAKRIMATGEVTKSRAALIARTEVGRTATALTEARSLHIGAETYIWRTAEDSDVRPTHADLNGTVQRWDSPPECDPGYHAHPGAIFNCRCYPEPIIPDPGG